MPAWRLGWTRDSRGMVILRDVDGRRHALRMSAVVGIHETEEGLTAVSVVGGGMLLLDEEFDAIIALIGVGDRPGQPMAGSGTA